MVLVQWNGLWNSIVKDVQMPLSIMEKSLGKGLQVLKIEHEGW